MVTPAELQHLSEKPGADVVEVSYNAGRIVDLSRVELDGVSLKGLYLAGEPRDQRAVGQPATDRQVDNLVYELCGLTDEEIRIVEEATSSVP